MICLALEALLCKKSSVVWGGAGDLGFENVLSTVIVYLLSILSNRNIYVWNVTLLLLLLLFVAVLVIVIFTLEAVAAG